MLRNQRWLARRTWKRTKLQRVCIYIYMYPYNIFNFFFNFILPLSLSLCVFFFGNQNWTINGRGWFLILLCRKSAWDQQEGYEHPGFDSWFCIASFVFCFSELMCLMYGGFWFVCLQCKVCMQTFICTTSEVKCKEHAEAKHPKADLSTCFPHLKKWFSYHNSHKLLKAKQASKFQLCPWFCHCKPLSSCFLKIWWFMYVETLMVHVLCNFLVYFFSEPCSPSTSTWLVMLSHTCHLQAVKCWHEITRNGIVPRK